jgi:hypothetical protein
MYGDEEAGIPAEELYTRYDAEQALNIAKKVLEHVEKLLQEITAKHFPPPPKRSWDLYGFIGGC